jgi:hypothetical protein
MPPKIKTDDIIDALLDSKVVDALANALSPLIKKIINESLDDKIAALAKAVTEAQQTSAKLSTRVAELTNENADMRLQLTSQGARLAAMETYSRLDNLIIKGLPEPSYAEKGTRGSADADESLHTADSHSAVESTVLAFCQDTLHIDISPSDISTAHRLRAGGKDKVRPVIVRFTNRRIRDAIYRAKKVLKNSSGARAIYISEHLTKHAAELFYECRKLLRNKKVHSTWTQHGQVYIKVSTDPSAKPILVKCLSDLNPYSR